jgi:hypothetical protein
MRIRDLRDELDLSASDNALAPSMSILFPVLSENEMKQQVVTAEID